MNSNLPDTRLRDAGSRDVRRRKRRYPRRARRFDESGRGGPRVPFLLVHRHAVIDAHIATRRSEFAYGDSGDRKKDDSRSDRSTRMTHTFFCVLMTRVDAERRPVARVVGL